MLRFGLFTSHSGDEEARKQMETIVEYLCFILEYDEAYCNELAASQPWLLRHWVTNQKKQ
jgi:hypothetical protein